MDTNTLMSKYHIYKLNKLQLNYLENYNRKQDNLLYVAIAFNLLIFFINVDLIQIILGISVLCIFLKKIHKRLALKKNILVLGNDSDIVIEQIK